MWSHRIFVILYFNSKIINQIFSFDVRENLDIFTFVVCLQYINFRLKPEIVTVQYNSRAGISNVVIFPGGRGSWSLNRKNSKKYWISNIKRNLVLRYNTCIYTCPTFRTTSSISIKGVCKKLHVEKPKQRLYSRIGIKRQTVQWLPQSQHMEWSEWVIVVAILERYHDENISRFNEMMMMYALS